jgi:hypothetical protein
MQAQREPAHPTVTAAAQEHGGGQRSSSQGAPAGGGRAAQGGQGSQSQQRQQQVEQQVRRRGCGCTTLGPRSHAPAVHFFSWWAGCVRCWTRGCCASQSVSELAQRPGCAGPAAGRRADPACSPPWLTPPVPWTCRHRGKLPHWRPQQLRRRVEAASGRARRAHQLAAAGHHMAVRARRAASASSRRSRSCRKSRSCRRSRCGGQDEVAPPWARRPHSLAHQGVVTAHISQLLAAHVPAAAASLLPARAALHLRVRLLRLL